MRAGQGSSNRPADGEVQRGGPHGAGTQNYPRADNVIPFKSRFLPDSRAQSREPFILTIDVRELGALLLVAAVAFIPWAFVACVVFLYLTLVG